MSETKRNGDERDGPSKECEWQESNLRTPTRTDLESVTFGLLVTLAPKFIIERVIYRHNSYVVLSLPPLASLATLALITISPKSVINS